MSIRCSLIMSAVVMFSCTPSSASEFYTIQVIDSQTGRGVPLVELSPRGGTRLVTDSNGIVAFDQAALMEKDVLFGLRSYGYSELGKILRPSTGNAAIVPIDRVNRAERLYRVTGAGIYRDSVRAGASVPIDQPLLNAGVIGLDSVQTAIYRDKIHWFWGDTFYENGGYNFRSTGATSVLPEQGGLDPAYGVNLNYFTAPGGNAAQMMPLNETGLVWLDGVFTVQDNSGRQRLLARQERHLDLETIVEQGLALFNDDTETFQRFQNYDLSAKLVPQGHAFQHTVGGDGYIYFTLTYPNVRVKADWDHVTDLSQWEAFTPLKENSRYDAANPPLDLDQHGKPIFAWKRNADPLSYEMLDDLVRNERMARSELPFRLEDFATGKAVRLHRSSVEWNEYRDAWIMIGVESFGDSFLGEVWFSEAPTPEGPWASAVKVVTHDRGASGDYSFYNPSLHPYFDQEGGRFIYFEGTYSNTFSNNPNKTPLYDYNQLMYRLDLAEIPALFQRVPEPATLAMLVLGLAFITRQRIARATTPFVVLAAMLIPASFARADIFQWEYINPAEPSQGRQQSSMLAPDGAGVSAAPGANLSYRNLTMAYLIGADLLGAVFSNTNLTDAELSQANLTHAYFGGYSDESEFHYTDLTGANLSQANLTNARFDSATLTDANLTGAELRGANFHSYISVGGVSLTQLYSTASYEARDLRGVGFGNNNLTGVNLAGQNLAGANFFGTTLTSANFHQAHLTNVDFYAATLTGANLSQADLTNANFAGFVVYDEFGNEITFPGANLTNVNVSGADARGASFQYAIIAFANASNLIWSNGHIGDLDLTAGASLVIRDYDGNPAVSTGPLPIVVEEHLAMDATGTLQLVFDADPWDSSISFAPGIPVALGGTLELAFSPDVDPASQLGRTIDLFDWSGVTPTGAFTVSSTYTWDLSNLYTTGEVTLAVAPNLNGDFNNDGTVDAADYIVWRKTGGTSAGYNMWRSHFGQPSGSGSVARANATVPEPATAVMLIVGTLAILFRRQTGV